MLTIAVSKLSTGSKFNAPNKLELKLILHKVQKVTPLHTLKRSLIKPYDVLAVCIMKRVIEG